MHQNVFGLTFGWVLDPGPVALEEYGDSDWAGINFDGWYAGLGIGQSKYGDIDEASANTRTEGWKVYGGYQFNKYLGIEGGYANLNDMTSRTGAVVTNLAADAWTLGAVLSYPVTEKLSVMGKLGAAYVLADAKGEERCPHSRCEAVMTAMSPTMGWRQYALLDNLNLRLEWERFDRKEYDIDLVTAGWH